MTRPASLSWKFTRSTETTLVASSPTPGLELMHIDSADQKEINYYWDMLSEGESGMSRKTWATAAADCSRVPGRGPNE